MHTRRTSDYTPCLPGSKEENQAYNARREMMKTFADRPAIQGPARKTWTQRMTERAAGFSPR